MKSLQMDHHHAPLNTKWVSRADQMHLTKIFAFKLLKDIFIELPSGFVGGRESKGQDTESWQSPDNFDLLLIRRNLLQIWYTMPKPIIDKQGWVKITSPSEQWKITFWGAELKSKLGWNSFLKITLCLIFLNWKFIFWFLFYSVFVLFQLSAVLKKSAFAAALSPNFAM